MGDLDMRWMALCALTLLAGCGYQYGSDGPNYVRPDAASLDLDFLSLTEPCQPGQEEACKTGTPITPAR